METYRYKCLYITTICIAAWNIFLIFLWQKHELEEYQWMKDWKKIDSETRYPENNYVEDRQFYIFYAERPEFIHDTCWFIVWIVLLLAPIHVITSIILLFGIIKEAFAWILLFLLTAVPLIILPIIYAVIWFNKDIFDDQLIMCIIELVVALLINVPCVLIVSISYFYRIPEKNDYLPRCDFDKRGIWDNYGKYFDDPTKRPGYPESIDLDNLSIDESVSVKKDKDPKSPTLSIRRYPYQDSKGWASRTTLENIKKERQKREAEHNAESQSTEFQNPEFKSSTKFQHSEPTASRNSKGYNQMFLMDKSCRKVIQNSRNF